MKIILDKHKETCECFFFRRIKIKFQTFSLPFLDEEELLVKEKISQDNCIIIILDVLPKT